MSGLDADRRALEIARRKHPDLDLSLHEGWADAPPFEAETFDHVVSSLMFHHLATPTKMLALSRARDLLVPGGELHILDWGEAGIPLMRFAFFGIQLLDGFSTTSDNVAGLLPGMMRDAGFVEVAETHRTRTLFGVLSLYRARKPMTS